MDIIVKQIKDKGKIVYEYNPLFNYRINSELLDLITPDFKFSLKYPVDIQCQTSYDGSVNLILNDGLNKSRLINSRFRMCENNTYEVINRSGNNDANLYDKELFDSDTSLVKSVKRIPQILFTGLDGSGQLACGSYNFYFKYEDDDGNETDFIGETGSIVCHVGLKNSPGSIRSGLENENSGKAINIIITNLDESYKNLRVYYSRRTSSAHNESIVEFKKVLNKYTHQNGQFSLRIDGNEQTIPSTLAEINKDYFRFDSAKTQVLCGGRLFLGNLSKNSIDYKEFCDVSLRILPYYDSIDVEQLGTFNTEYHITKGNGLYYNTFNIYSKVGYWNEEIYRLGIVYILNDDSLTPVFNIRGMDGIPTKNEVVNSYTKFNFLDKDGNRLYVEFDNYSQLISLNNIENCKGVVRIKDDLGSDKIYNFGIHIPDDIISYMQKTLSIKGFFLVRLKRIANLLTQAFVIGHDPYSGVPALKVKDKYIVESFVDDHGVLTNSYYRRTRNLKSADNQVAICPDYQVRQELYNNFFTNSDFVIREIQSYDLQVDTYSERSFYAKKNNEDLGRELKTVPIIGVPDSTPIKRTNLSLFRAQAGSAESYNFETIDGDFDIDFGNKDANVGNVIRGNFGSFLGLSGYKGKCNKLINIYIPDYSEHRMNDYFKQRYIDTTPYYAITERIPINTNVNDLAIYRGDCYICLYTHRIHRNFQDTNAPTNDTIVDLGTFLNYKPTTSPSSLADINVGDLNAIKIGSWLTFTVRSSNNLSMRDYDGSRIEESLLMGNNRSFYPLTTMSEDGAYKLPESTVFNNGISLLLSEKVYFELPEVPYLKTNFLNRICYSDVAVIDSFKNGYRTFQSTNYQDYSNEFGGIMKLVEWQNNIVVIFEHGIGILPINERVMAGSGSGGDVILNTNRVLPQQINMITTDYGTQWPDSVIKTEFGIYGVDTVAKKIWKFANNTITIISERKVQKFLNENITFSERTLTPIIGICNLKTHYNKFKRDIMFTFYNQLEGIEEVAWNLCFNEYTQRFTTFYSWIPSFSENIDNIFFSYDRDTSKKLASIEYNKEGSIAITEHVDQQINIDRPFTIIAPVNSVVTINNLPNNTNIYYTNIAESWDDANVENTGPLVNGFVSSGLSTSVAISIPAKPNSDSLGIIHIKGKLGTQANIQVTNSYGLPIPFTIEGNIRTLVDSYKEDQWSEDYKDVTVYSLSGLFENSSVEDASNLIFPDSVVYENAFENMFKNCKNLKFGPTHLPAKVLFDYAYKNMFYGCESMILGPSKLEANYVGNQAYCGMFNGCSKLSNVIKLKAAYDPPYVIPIYNSSADVTVDTHLKVDKPSDSFKENGVTYPFMTKEKVNVLKSGLEYMEQQNTLDNYRIFTSYVLSNLSSNTENKQPLPTPVIIQQDKIKEGYNDKLTASAYTNMFSGCYNLKYINLLDINKNDTIELITDRTKFSGNYLIDDVEIRLYFSNEFLLGRVKTNDFYNFNYNLIVNNSIPKHSTVKWEFSNKQYFRADSILAIHNGQLYITDVDKVEELLEKYKYVPININATVYNTDGSIYSEYSKTFYLSTYDRIDEITTDFWKHGLGGIIDIKDTIKPSTWYGKVHPFEFEYVVREDLDKQKTFDSLQIISNNVAPESFHYEIVGDSYDFSLDKLNMYVRLELTKELYLINGSDITYNRNYKSLLPEVRQRDTYTLNKLNSDISQWKQISQYKDKSTLLPSYYKRDDTIHEVYDYYAKATSPNKNYSQLSGTEITYDLGMSLFNLVNHVEAVDMKDPIQGRLRGNMLYLEDKWYVQINPINLVQKNEKEWPIYNVGTEINPKYQHKIPLNVYYLLLHNDIKNISTDKLPSLTSTTNYLFSDIDTLSWGNRKEVKLKDKYMKVKIRYNTDKLALIVGVNTLYRI